MTENQARFFIFYQIYASPIGGDFPIWSEDMKINGKVISGSSILTILGVVCFATVLVAAAITWATFTTAPQNPVTQVLLGEPTTNEWTTDYVPDGEHPYNLVFSATYNFGAEASFTYYLTVDATATGLIENGDFTITLSGVGEVAFNEVEPGKWQSGAITISSENTSDEITFSIVPNAGSIDLSAVSFTVNAVSSL